MSLFVKVASQQRAQLMRMSCAAFSTNTFGKMHNRVALVTGAGGGIGKSIAQKFYDEGAHVVIADLNYDNAKAVAESFGSRGFAVKVDVTNEDEVNNSVQTAVDQFGALDVLVSNAGHQYIDPIVDIPYAQWKKMIAVHLDASFLYTRAALRQMYKAGTKNGKILLMGSIHSKEASVLKSPYVAAKHGILGFARAAAKEAGPKGISVNVICPGFVLTPLVQKQIPEQAKNLGITEQEVVKRVMLGNTVDGEFSMPEDVAEVALFLASFPTNALTGQSYNISHGWCMN